MDKEFDWEDEFSDVRYENVHVQGMKRHIQSIGSFTFDINFFNFSIKF